MDNGFILTSVGQFSLTLKPNIMRKFVSKKKEIGGLLPEGDHVGTIVEIAMEKSKKQENWKDVTDQLKVTVKNTKGQSTAWLNLTGYKNQNDFEGGIAPKGFHFASFDDASEQFLVKTSTGKRVTSDERTEKLLTNVDNLINAGGIETGEELDLDEIVDALLDVEIGIRVKKNTRGVNELSYFMKADEVSVTA